MRFFYVRRDEIGTLQTQLDKLRMKLDEMMKNARFADYDEAQFAETERTKDKMERLQTDLDKKKAELDDQKRQSFWQPNGRRASN